MRNPRKIIYVFIFILRNVLHFIGVEIGTAQGFPFRARPRQAASGRARGVEEAQIAL